MDTVMKKKKKIKKRRRVWRGRVVLDAFHAAVEG